MRRSSLFTVVVGCTVLAMSLAILGCGKSVSAQDPIPVGGGWFPAGFAN